MADWKPSEYWKRVTCMMMIRAGYENANIMTTAQCSLNTVKTVRRDMESCNGDYEAVASRKGHARRSDTVRTSEFIQQLRDKVKEDPSKGIRALAREMGVGVATMKLALSEDLRDYAYKDRKEQNVAAKENRLTKAKRAAMRDNIEVPAQGSDGSKVARYEEGRNEEKVSEVCI